jgi:hypothetical protein
VDKLSKPVKIGAIVVLMLVVGVVGFKVLGKSHGSGKPVYTAAPKVPTPLHPTTHGKPKIQLDPGLPTALRAALEAHGVVIAVVYGQGDSAAVANAILGARAAHAGFAALNIESEGVARDVALLAPGLTDPTVLVVRRPGTISAALPGYSDSDTVAQAAVEQPVTTTAESTGLPVAPTTPVTSGP